MAVKLTFIQSVTFCHHQHHFYGTFFSLQFFSKHKKTNEVFFKIPSRFFDFLFTLAHAFTIIDSGWKKLSNNNDFMIHGIIKLWKLWTIFLGKKCSEKMEISYSLYIDCMDAKNITSNTEIQQQQQQQIETIITITTWNCKINNSFPISNEWWWIREINRRKQKNIK